jgi:hypothetical protein
MTSLPASSPPTQAADLHGSRPLLVVANSSWYLAHYRQLLLEQLQHDGQHVVALSPVDSSTPELSRLLIHIPWRIHRSTDSNPFSFAISFLRMLFLVRAIKPRLVHSHTLKANLLTAVVTAMFGIPCVLSFAGMGRLSKSQGPLRLAFVMVLSSIAFFAVRQRCSRWRWRLAPRRTAFIFQNPIDRSLFEAALPYLSSSRYHLIAGSGVPSSYLPQEVVSRSGEQALSELLPNQWWQTQSEMSPFADPCCELIFCGRLLRSKGIGTFLQIERDFAKRFVAVGRIHLIGLLVGLAEILGRTHRIPEGTVEARGVLGRVGHDPGVDVTRALQGLANRPDTPVHHVGWRDDVDAGGSLHQRLIAQDLDSGFVDHITVVVDHTVLTM